MEISFAQMMKIEERRQQAFEKLQQTLELGNFAAAEQMIREENRHYSSSKAYHICSSAIRSGCSRETFELLLEYCPPLWTIVNYSACWHRVVSGYISGLGGLVQEAAAENNAAVLEYLLEKGFTPNAQNGEQCSALEAALWGKAPDALRLLRQREDADFTVTERILAIWAGMGQDSDTDACLCIAAGRLLGDAPDTVYEEVPLLPGLTILHAAERTNWPLVMRLCREQDVTVEQGKQVVDRYMANGMLLNVSECAALLDALFAVCPALLRCDYPRYVLALCALCGEEAPEQARFWAEMLPGRQLLLCGRGQGEREYDVVIGLHRWQERLGSHLQPVLRRDRMLPLRMAFMTDDESIHYLMNICAIRGNPPKEGVSRLALNVLYLASNSLLAQLCDEGKLFVQENLTALMDCCEKMPIPRGERLEKRAVLMSHLKKEVNYEL